MPDLRTELALTALREFAPAEQIGELVEQSEPNDEGVRTLRFAASVPGHGDWSWVVWLAELDDSVPTVLECDLLPGEDALLAPAWIPWAERLAEFRATHDRKGNLVVEDDEDDEMDDDAAEYDGDLDEAASDPDEGASDDDPAAEAPSRGKRASQRTQRRTRRRRRRRS